MTAREPLTHLLKCWPMYFAPLAAGHKTLELRRDDRPFRVGDLFVAQEFDPNNSRCTGRQCLRVITYVGRKLPGLQDGYVALGLRELLPQELEKCANTLDRTNNKRGNA